MTSVAYAIDASRLASTLVGFGPLPTTGPPPTSGVYVFDLHIRAARLPNITASLQALQLAFDAATLAAMHRRDHFDVVDVQEILDKPDVSLNVMWAAPGSLRLSVNVNPLTGAGRSKIREIVGLAAIALGVLTGSAIAVAGLAFGVEAILRLAAYEERRRADGPFPVTTFEQDWLETAHLQVTVTPPGVPWRPPTERDPAE